MLTEFWSDATGYESRIVGGRRHPAAAVGFNPPMFASPEPAQPASAQPIAALVIDAEEDFDWLRPLPGTPYSTACMHRLGDIQSIAGAWGVPPTYMLTYPVLQDRQAVTALRRYFERGECALGVQLHTWVTPPLEGRTDIAGSFASNLSPALEQRKILTLREKFISCFGIEPVAYRAGRYGIGAATARILEEHGFSVDTSVAPRTAFRAEGGPDFSAFDCTPFWFGARRRLLEVPLCRSIVGWGGPLARKACQTLSEPPMSGFPINAVLARSRAAARITLSPEGNEVAAMRRLVRGLLARGCTVLSVSMHSSSLAVGRNPYVRSKADLHRLHDRLSAILAFLADNIGCRLVGLPDIPGLMRPSSMA